jgi:hypothetical protein
MMKLKKLRGMTKHHKQSWKNNFSEFFKLLAADNNGIDVFDGFYSFFFCSHDSLKATLPVSSDDIDIETNLGLEHGHIALMFAGFILISVTLYMSLIYYRNKLE